MKRYAVIENNKVINIIVDPGADAVAAEPSKYIDLENGWDFNSGIDGGIFFPPILIPNPE